jgi:hypothetical protein
MTGEWMEIRCKSRTCTTPGGRILYRERVGGGVSIKRKRTGVIVIGVPVFACCSCGWVWRNGDLTAFLDDMDDCQTPPDVVS